MRAADTRHPDIRSEDVDQACYSRHLSTQIDASKRRAHREPRACATMKPSRRY